MYRSLNIILIISFIAIVLNGCTITRSKVTNKHNKVSMWQNGEYSKWRSRVFAPIN